MLVVLRQAMSLVLAVAQSGEMRCEPWSVAAKNWEDYRGASWS